MQEFLSCLGNKQKVNNNNNNNNNNNKDNKLYLPIKFIQLHYINSVEITNNQKYNIYKRIILNNTKEMNKCYETLSSNNYYVPTCLN